MPAKLRLSTLHNAAQTGTGALVRFDPLFRAYTLQDYAEYFKQELPFSAQYWAKNSFISAEVQTIGNVPVLVWYIPGADVKVLRELSKLVQERQQNKFQLVNNGILSSSIEHYLNSSLIAPVRSLLFAGVLSSLQKNTNPLRVPYETPPSAGERERQLLKDLVQGWLNSEISVERDMIGILEISSRSFKIPTSARVEWTVLAEEPAKAPTGELLAGTRFELYFNPITFGIGFPIENPIVQFSWNNSRVSFTSQKSVASFFGIVQIDLALPNGATIRVHISGASYRVNLVPVL